MLSKWQWWYGNLVLQPLMKSLYMFEFYFDLVVGLPLGLYSKLALSCSRFWDWPGCWDCLLWMKTQLFSLGSLPSSTLYRYVPAYVDGSNFQVLQWNLSNVDTNRTKIFVLINEVSLFQGKNKVGTQSSILSLFQGCPFRDITLYAIIKKTF